MRVTHYFNWYNDFDPDHDRRRDNISNYTPTDGADDRFNGDRDNYYNDDPDSYGLGSYRYGPEYDPTPAFRTALWAIYCIAGGDPNGDSKFHCSDRDAIRATIEAVKELERNAQEHFDNYLHERRKSS